MVVVMSKATKRNPNPEPSPSEGAENVAVPVVNSFGRILVTFAIAGLAIYYRLQPIWREDPNAMVLATWNNTIGTSGIQQQLPCSPEHSLQFPGFMSSYFIVTLKINHMMFSFLGCNSTVFPRYKFVFHFINLLFIL